MSNLDVLDELEHFNEPEFFVKKYNSMHYLLELGQDVFNEREIEKFNECASYLKYAIFKTDDNYFERKLVYANFCKNRWCQLCNWRRALKYQAILNNRIDLIKSKHKSLKFIFITFTIKNTHFKFLKRDLKVIMMGFRRLFRDFSRVSKNKAIKGYVRSLEFTLQKDDINYINLHIHTLIAVSKNYFEKKYDYYLSQEEWTELWQKAVRVEYTPVIDVRTVKKRGKNKNLTKEQMAVKEVVKYVLKGVDILRLQREKRVDIFQELYKSMKNVRNIGFGGIFAPKNFKKNENEEDLIHITDDNTVNGEFLGEAVYVLENGYYRLKDFKEKD